MLACIVYHVSLHCEITRETCDRNSGSFSKVRISARISCSFHPSSETLWKLLWNSTSRRRRRRRDSRRPARRPLLAGHYQRTITGPRLWIAKRKLSFPTMHFMTGCAQKIIFRKLKKYVFSSIIPTRAFWKFLAGLRRTVPTFRCRSRAPQTSRKFSQPQNRRQATLPGHSKAGRTREHVIFFSANQKDLIFKQWVTRWRPSPSRPRLLSS